MSGFWIFVSLFAISCAYLAQKRGRNVFWWFFMGGLFGPFALLWLLCLQNLKNTSRTERQYTYQTPLPEISQEKPQTHKWAWIMALIICSALIYGLMVSTQEQGKETQEKESPRINREAEKKEFLKALDQKYKEMQQALQKKQLARAWGIAHLFVKYQKTDYKEAADLIETIKKQYKKKLLKQVKKIPASQAAANLNIYKLLQEMEPTNSVFKKKVAFYAQKVALQKHVGRGALHPYDRKNYPRLFAKYGSRIKDVERYRRLAAEMVLKQKKCDYIDLVELSTRSPLDNLLFWIDCGNDRIWVSEAEIKANQKILSQAERAWDHNDAINACKKMIRLHATIPSSVTFHDFVGLSVREADITHNVVVHLDFDARNAFGAQIPFTAICTFPPGQGGSIRITAKR